MQRSSCDNISFNLIQLIYSVNMHVINIYFKKGGTVVMN